MSSNQPYSLREFADDFFVAAFLTLLIYTLVELVRPGAISAILNLPVWFLLTAVLGLGLVIKGESRLFKRATRGICFLVAFLVGAILLVATPTIWPVRIILGLLSIVIVLALRKNLEL